MNIDYKKMYIHLFNAVTDALELLPESSAARILIAAQKRCEEMYLHGEEPLPPSD